VKANDGGAGVDRQSVEDFEGHLSENLKHLSEQLREGRFQPQPVRRVWIDKLGSREKRPLGIPTVGDRVVQAALRMVLEPIFERALLSRVMVSGPTEDARTHCDAWMTCSNREPRGSSTPT
jgi:RNA-directed DNA polymerase